VEGWEGIREGLGFGGGGGEGEEREVGDAADGEDAVVTWLGVGG
jgi:hypothetical protein